ncbi:hypothetical protein BC834DRAFT_857886 [Gloeopeniophorella convolvens]|nr:hypothetical protein BC834DRAFT_857886 [Gloeopeniophorella convolvens]
MHMSLALQKLFPRSLALPKSCAGPVSSVVRSRGLHAGHLTLARRAAPGFRSPRAVSPPLLPLPPYSPNSKRRFRFDPRLESTPPLPISHQPSPNCFTS